MGVLDKILILLKEKNFEHLTHEHVHTSQDAAKVRGTKLEQAAKAIVLKEKKSGDFFMFVLGGNKKIDLKKVKKEILGVKNISLAPADEVLKLTTCTVGSVPPFGNLFGIPIYFDQHLLDAQEQIVFSAGTHYDSIKMKTKDYLDLVKPIVIFFST